MQPAPGPAPIASIAMTGASGFLGSHVVPLLRGQHRAVHVLGRRPPADRPDSPSTDLLAGEPDWARFASPPPEALVHCAGIMGVDEASVLGSAAMALHVLKGLPRSVRRVVLVSSAYVNAPSTVPVREDDLPRPTDVYGHTKLMVEELFRAHAKATHRELVILRPCAIYGPGDPNRKAITIFIADARASKRPTLVGAVTSPRDYVHVRDAARAIVLALDVDLAAIGHDDERGVRVYNVCTGGTWSALDLARLIGQLRPDLGAPDDARPNDAVGFRFDPSRATRELGFTATTDLRAALEELLAKETSTP
jgi:nucleoside-diphosphate-sugar epimerase